MILTAPKCPACLDPMVLRTIELPSMREMKYALQWVCFEQSAVWEEHEPVVMAVGDE